MLDRWTNKWVQVLILPLTQFLKRKKISPDTITWFSFLLGVGGIVLIALGNFIGGLVLVLLNRLGDGLDGNLARLTNKATDRGSFLDIVLDFIFYSGVILGFAIHDINHNGLAAIVLMFSFVGTGVSFLTFSLIAERRNIKNTIYQDKGIYYLTGITEGTETIFFFIVICLFPSYFPILSFIFAFFCFITTFSRIFLGYTEFKDENQ